VILDAPVVIREGDSTTEFLVFHLDSQPDLEFRQMVRALASVHQKGEKVRVHYHVDSSGVAQVDWTERA
jgi:hypothetical protein